ncbi:MAG TPA: DNA ligase D, partial [Candidatus Limnocylindria bacterium]
RPDFSLLQAKLGDKAATALVYQAFDLLYLDGRSLLDVPLENRKRLLRARLREHPVVRYASHVVGDGLDFTQAAMQRGLEGVVAKRLGSAYASGKRSRDWLKLKLRAEQEVVVVGWLPGQGTHKDLGSLIVAVNEDGALRHAGQVGSGIDARMRRRLLAEMEPLRRPDAPLERKPRLPQARWIEPRIVIRTEFSEWTRDGLLRQAAFKGVEIDRDPGQVIREKPIPSQRVLSGTRPRSRSRGAAATASPPPEAAQAVSAEFAAATEEELAALDAMRRDGHWQVAGHEVRLTNLDKVLFPADGEHPALTKRDLIRYYARIGPTILPYLAHRGVTLHRYPDGIGRGDGFWQKDIPGHAPAWVARWDYTGHEGPKTYIVVDRVATLAWLAQEGAVEIHPWTSRTEAPREPTYALIDVDPGTRTTWEEVLLLTRLYRTALDHLGVIGLPKVTGKRGVQVWVPIRAGYTFEDTRNWVQQLSLAVGRPVSDLVSWEWTKVDRKGRARLDFTQNAVNKTLVAPYSVRPSVGAPVSAPIRWEELEDPILAPDQWNIRTIFERLADVGDPFRPAVELKQELPPL